MSSAEDQLDMFTPTTPAPVMASNPVPPSRRRSRGSVSLTPQAAGEVLADVHLGKFGMLDDSDRVVLFEDPGRVRFAAEEDVALSLLQQRFIERQPPRDTESCLHGVIRKPVTPLRLTKSGRALLNRWASLVPLPGATSNDRLKFVADL
ncbi:MAG: hypothetical protein M3548_02455 [Actinomycetota bacterium]|nr:hypothetical protein [Actinomycetota bacterium]